MYEPLDPSRRQIRLLRIVGGSDDGPIQCVLHTVSLDDVDFGFAALSYVWGDERITREVVVNGHLRAVTTNLESALRNFWRYSTDNAANIIRRSDVDSSVLEQPNGLTRWLRSMAPENDDLHHDSDGDGRNESGNNDDADGVKNGILIESIRSAHRRASVGCGELPIWIDALCINQDDPVEKSRQIPMMRDIFAKAGCVFSWLGPPDHRNIDVALRTIRKLAAHLHSSEYTREQLNQDHPELCLIHYYHAPFNPYWEAIVNFAESDYFQRLWIFQELWATDDAIFLCGDESLPMNTLLLYHTWAVSLDRDGEHPPSPPLIIPPLNAITQVYEMKGGLAVTAASEATRVFLDIVRLWRCKDPRDKVFALFGIFPMDIVPDYTMPVADVYANWATNPRQDLPLGSLLFYAGIGLRPRPPGRHNLASWQPNLDILGEQINAYDATYAYRYLDVEVPAKFRPTVSPTRCFTCFGVRVTQVREVAWRASDKPADLATRPSDASQTRHRSVRKSVLPVLKYLLDKRHRLWTEGYHTKGSPLWAFVETVNGCVDPYAADLTPEFLRDFSATKLFNELQLQTRPGVHDPGYAFTPEELSFMGFQSEWALWVCLEGLPSCASDDENIAQPSSDPGEHREEDIRQFVYRIWTFFANKSLFETHEGVVGGGPPGVEAGDLVYLVHGCSLPVLVREVEGKLHHVGVCHVPGISGAETFRVLEERESEVRELKLV